MNKLHSPFKAKTFRQQSTAEQLYWKVLEVEHVAGSLQQLNLKEKQLPKKHLIHDMLWKEWILQLHFLCFSKLSVKPSHNDSHLKYSSLWSPIKIPKPSDRPLVVSYDPATESLSQPSPHCWKSVPKPQFLILKLTCLRCAGATTKRLRTSTMNRASTEGQKSG